MKNKSVTTSESQVYTHDSSPSPSPTLAPELGKKSGDLNLFTFGFQARNFFDAGNECREAKLNFHSSIHKLACLIELDPKYAQPEKLFLCTAARRRKSPIRRVSGN